MTPKLNYKLAVVGMDLTAMDDYLLDFLPTLLKAFPLQRVIFVHIAKQLELPEEIIHKYPDLIEPLDESIANELEQKVAPHFEQTDISFDIIVQEGQPLESFLKITRIKNADLIVMGRKRELQGSGILAGDVVRKGQTSMLFVTEQMNLKIDKILIPSDFSNHTLKTLEVGGMLKKRVGSSLELLHLYRVPQGYSKTGKSFEEFSELMRYHSEKEYEKFRKTNDLKEIIPCQYLDLGDDSESHFIINHAHEINSDLILIGSRGRTNTSALLLGSMAEKLVFENSVIPILVVKNKGENLGFFEALMKL